MSQGRATLGRRDLLALHRRHAGRVRAVHYWLGADLDVLDALVLRTFQLAARRGGPADLDDARAWLGRLAWRVATAPHRPTPSRSRREPAARPRRPGRAPRLSPAADALARFLADHSALPRALLVLAEFTGLTPAALAAELRAPVDVLRDALVDLRRGLAADPLVIELGGPQAVLSASLAPFLADDEWQAHHAAELAATLPGARDPGELLRRPTTIVGLGALALAALLLARPGPALPALRTIAVRDAAPVPLPTLRTFPPPVPTAMPPAPGPSRKPVKVRPAAAAAPRADALAARERLARTRDPGAIIVELEMLGAARKALAQSPRQALAYTDQHASEYPNSQLVDQRVEVRVRALCALQRAADARAEAARRNTPRVQTALREACP